MWESPAGEWRGNRVPSEAGRVKVWFLGYGSVP